MKFCKLHWDRLKVEIENQGMSHLVAQNGEYAAHSMVKQIKGIGDKSDFDPLMNAFLSITGVFLDNAGLAGFEGDKCPLCEVDKQTEGLAEDWVKGAVKNQLDYARKHKIIHGEQ